MPSQESHDGPDRNDDTGLAQAQSHVLDLFPFANQLVCTVAHARQALRSRQKLREVLRAHLCRAFCSAHVSNCACMDMQTPRTSNVQEMGGHPRKRRVDSCLARSKKAKHATTSTTASSDCSGQEETCRRSTT